MGDLTNYDKWKYSSWTLCIFVIFANPWIMSYLICFVRSKVIAFIILSILFLLTERLLMEAD
jgi:hypothetical protein